MLPRVLPRMLPRTPPLEPGEEVWATGAAMALEKRTAETATMAEEKRMLAMCVEEFLEER